MKMTLNRLYTAGAILLLLSTPLISFAQGITRELHFSNERGFYQSAFDLTITVDEPEAVIKYTLDGTDPSQSPTAVSKTAPATVRIDPLDFATHDRAPGIVIRALAQKSGAAITRTYTHSFLFVDKIGQLSPDGVRPGPRWPQPGTINDQVIDYGMDPDILNNALYRDQITNAMLAVPSISFVTDPENLFNRSTGIYVNALNYGREWERPVSVELLNPDSSAGFQIDAGMRIRGGWGRYGYNRKHAFRLFFRGEYGAAKLEFPLFGDEGVDRFDCVDLACPQNYSWTKPGDDDLQNTFLRDVFSRDTQRDMGQPYTRSRYYHLYINGTYWGLYYTQERSEASYAVSYFGGAKEDYDVVKVAAGPLGPKDIEATDGDLEAYRRLWEAAVQGFGTKESYFKIQGLNPDGTRNPGYERLLDVDNLIDYMLCTFFVGDFDAPISNFFGNVDPNNFYGIYNRSRQEGFYYFRHDAEHTMFNVPQGIDRTGPYPAGQLFQDFNPQWLHQQLVQNPEYVMRFADRVQKHFFGDGALTTQACIDRISSRKQQIETAIIAESARWGDAINHPARTKAVWEAAANWIIQSFLPTRNSVVLAQFRNKGWFPAVPAPTFSHPGGQVEKGFAVSINPQQGKIYYTTDGKDPVVLQSSSGGTSKTLIAASSAKRVLVPQNAISATWTSILTFNDSQWQNVTGSPGGIGYEKDSGYESFISYDVSPQMYNDGSAPNANTSCYVRIKFQVDAADLQTFNRLTLKMRYDDGFTAFLNGQNVAASLSPSPLSWNSAATENHEATSVDVFDVSAGLSRLVAGENLLAIQGLNVSNTSSDFIILLELEAGETSTTGGTISESAQEYTGPITINTTTVIKARAQSGNTWSALAEAQYSVAEDMSALRLTEILYKPLPEDSIPGAEFEFIELQNTGSSPLNLSLAAFVNGIDYTFPAGTTVDGGAFVVLASNQVQFFNRYGFLPFGEYQGQLDNAGERVVLVQANGDTIFSIRYDDEPPWPVGADTLGYSLVPISTSPALDLNNGANWTRSAEVGGSPGRKDLATDVRQVEASTPASFILFQNYPNPFNPTTMIRFSLPDVGTSRQGGIVSLKVYDLLGREVRTLVSEVKPPGSYTVQWNAEGVASGVYFYRIEAGAFRETKKLILLR
jgi:hypothetical protein